MEEIYRSCPEFENNDYILRMVRQEDRLDGFTKSLFR